jgi:predicted metalloprotease with PDZ domain
VLSESSRNIADVQAIADGKVIDAAKPNDYTWTLPTTGVKKLVFTYTVPVSITDEMGHYRGPASYVYVVGRKAEKCNLTIEVPNDWNLALGLDGDKGRYWAKDYDTLADNPVTFGKYRELRYYVYNTPHIIALYGQAKDDLDVDKLMKACSYISASQNDFFGGKPPYNHYVWHFNVGRRPDGGGGLEHLSSTEITLANGLGDGIIGVNAHEFFHLWNVKRIRSRVLGPFDYTQLPQTGALWWLEGCTEYFSHQLMTRYGYWDDKKWYSTIVRNTQNVRNVAARLEVGPYEASFRVREANNNRGNSNGYKISYYDLGVLAGTCLDIEIITRSNGKRSLDDVEHALWEMCKDGKPGFEEGEIRALCVKFGGPTLGDFYDTVIMKGGEMPMEQQLAKVGLNLTTSEKEFTDMGVTMGPGRNGGPISVRNTTGPADGKLQRGDQILSINGSEVPTNGALTAVTEKIKPGDSVTFKVKRGEETVDVTIVAAKGTRKTQEILEDGNATAQQKALREFWLYRGKKNWKVPELKTKR